MLATDKKPLYVLDISTPGNGKLGKPTVFALDPDGNTLASGKADLFIDKEREKLARTFAQKLGEKLKLEIKSENVLAVLEDTWNKTLDQHRRFSEQAKTGSPEAAVVGTVQLLDAAPPTIRRPLCLVDGQSYAAAWVPVQHTVSRTIENGIPVEHNPPLVSIEDALLIVTGDGTLYADGSAPGARPLAELGLPVQLPVQPPPDKTWSGAGVKRYLQGDRPDPAEVFRRVAAVIDRFVDFRKSLGPQEIMCKLVACHVLATCSTRSPSSATSFPTATRAPARRR
jgi:hypothetical protein